MMRDASFRRARASSDPVPARPPGWLPGGVAAAVWTGSQDRLPALAGGAPSVLQRPRSAGGAGAASRGAMSFPVRSCALVGRFADPRIADCLATLVPHLVRRGVEVDRKSTRLNSSHSSISYAVFCL